jgi:outer membrane protein assembly factor BamB
MKYTFMILCVILFSSCYSNSTEVQNEKDGNISLDTLWTFNLGSFAKPMPLVSGDTIYTAGGTNVFSINKYTGEQHWSTSIQGDVEIRGKQFLVNGENVIVNHVRKTFAWNRNTGEEVWQYHFNDDTLGIRMVGKHTTTPIGFSFNSTKDKAINLDHESNMHSIFQMTDNFNTNGVEYGEGKLFVGQKHTVNGAYTRGRMSAFDLYSGDSLWSYTTEYNGFSFAPPIYED